MSIYRLKPQFQVLLRPLADSLFRRGVTANQVTLAACLVSVVLGIALCLQTLPREMFLVIPGWMFLRMVLNALDGMLAREFGQKSNLGAYLNEVTDVVSDAALYLPFAFVAPLSAYWVALAIFLGALSEFVGVLGASLGASRRYDGPMGKSDRAFVFGALGLWVGVTAFLPPWSAYLMPAIALALVVTVVNRIRGGLKELTPRP